MQIRLIVINTTIDNVLWTSTHAPTQLAGESPRTGNIAYRRWVVSHAVHSSMQPRVQHFHVRHARRIIWKGLRHAICVSELSSLAESRSPVFA